MTEMQARELSLLAAFLEVCEACRLRYFLVCGSALGAVKYGGFIPWDDDIDVALPREDYEIFLKQAPERLPDYLFLQNYHTDPAFPQIYSKLRDSRTTCIEESSRFLPIHHGIGLDIFPLDGYPASKTAQFRLELGKKWYLHLLGSAFAPPRDPLHRLEYRVKRFFGVHRRTAQIAASYDSLVRRYPTEGSQIWCNHGSWQGRQEYTERDVYGTGTEGVFAGIRVRLPRDWDTYLQGKYGNYHSDPPPEKQRSHHRYSVVDFSRSYVYYIGEKDP